MKDRSDLPFGLADRPPQTVHRDGTCRRRFACEIGIFLVVFTTCNINTVYAGSVEEQSELRASGFALIKAAKYSEAEPVFQQLVRAEHADPEDVVWFGIVNLALGREESGQDLVRRGIGAAPTPLGAKMSYNVAEFMIRQKRWQDAKTFLQRAITLDPNVAQYHGTMGFVLFHLKEFELARIHYRIGNRLDPGVVWSDYYQSTEEAKKRLRGKPLPQPRSR